MSRKLWMAGVVVTALAAGSTVPSASAQAVPSESARTVVSTYSSVSDREVIELFVGQGRLVEEHPELAKYVPADQRELTPAQVSAVLSEYLEADPRFHENVTMPLQSGDPYQVLDALHSFEKTTKQFAGSTPVATGDGRCLVALAAGVVVWLGVSVYTYFWGTRTAADDAGAAFAAELARSFR